MSRYKRNQIEDALSNFRIVSSAKPSSELRTRVKRLLDMDRVLAVTRGPLIRKSRTMPFTAVIFQDGCRDMVFENYEAFALMIGLRLLQHGWPQGFPVSLLRRLRPELEREHARILKQDPAILFDEEAIKRKARPGDLYFGNTDPVLLTIVSGSDLQKEAARKPNAGGFSGYERRIQVREKGSGLILDLSRIGIPRTRCCLSFQKRRRANEDEAPK